MRYMWKPRSTQRQNSLDLSFQIKSVRFKKYKIESDYDTRGSETIRYVTDIVFYCLSPYGLDIWGKIFISSDHMDFHKK